MTARQTVAALAVLGAALVLDTTFADAQTKRSGTVVAIDPERRTLTLDELGLAGQPERHLVTLDAGVRVVEVQRRENVHTDAPGAWPGGFREVPARSLVPGDFVTITLAADERPLVARSIEIVRPDGGDSGSASPRGGEPRR